MCCSFIQGTSLVARAARVAMAAVATRAAMAAGADRAAMATRAGKWEVQQI